MREPLHRRGQCPAQAYCADDSVDSANACGTDGSCNGVPSTSNTQTYMQLHGSLMGGWAVLPDGAVTRWGVERFSPSSGTRFKTVAAGVARDRCGIVTAGTATCWGYFDSLVTSPPSGTFTAIAIGSSHACGVKSDGQMACWGNNTGGQAPATVPGTFQGYW